MTDIQGKLIDFAVGFVVPYMAIAGFLLLNRSDLDPGQIFFAFLLPVLFLVFPFDTLSYNPFGLAVILAIACAFFVDFRYVPPAYRRYAFGLTFAGWWAYGLYSMQWIAV